MSLTDSSSNRQVQLTPQANIADQITETNPSQSRATNILYNFDVVQSTASGIANGTILNLQTSLTSNIDSTVFESVEYAIYIDTVSDADRLLPRPSGAANTDISQWQIIGPYKGLVDVSTDVDLDLDNEREYITLRNISAGTVDVIFESRVKYIMNGG